MIKTVVYCDFCEKIVPLRIEVDPFGEEYVCIESGKTKEFDTSSMYPHMCGACANRIDDILRQFRVNVAHQASLASKFKQINKERKEQLGTEG